MISISRTVTPSDEWWEAVIRGVRNPYNSWDKSDSEWRYISVPVQDGVESECRLFIGENDLNLMKKLANAGDDHGKFLRMLPVITTINAPFYWWKEMDTYKIGTVADSCSTMHTITAKRFDRDDFSIDETPCANAMSNLMNDILDCYNDAKNGGDVEETKRMWRLLIQTLPTSYNQTRTWMGNYQVLKHIYHARKGHRLSEWETFRCWIRGLPYSELITGEGELYRVP